MRVLDQIHAQILTHPLISPSTNAFSLSKILCFAAYKNAQYAKRLLFHLRCPNIFGYNTVMRGFLQHSPSPEPILLFRRLIRSKSPASNTFTFAFVFKSCSILTAFDEGRQVHKHAIASGLGENLFVQTSLLNFYTKCEEMDLGRKVFDEMSDRNVVAWSAMIGGYARVGKVNEALEVFRAMQKGGVEPDEVTMVSVISACAMAGALDLGKWLHMFIDKNGIKNDLEVSTALVSMYAKCGCIEKARAVFEAMPVRDAKAWSSMIVGFAITGMAKEALDLFERMGEAQVEPNQVTLIGVLSACAHGGLVAEGRKYWLSMLNCGMEPSMEHYGCMVDLFCRANKAEEAYEFVASMPIAPNPAIWRTLVVSFKKNKMFHKGEEVAKQLIQLEPHNAENYILLSSLYASMSDWVKMSSVRRQMRDKRIKAVPGCSSIEINGHVHEFVVGDWSHPEAKAITEFIRVVSGRVQASGHEPWIASVLLNLGDREKLDALWEHSERLAIAYGLLKTKAPVTIRVVKNLRVCEDCHEVTKTISKLYNREIVVRDRIRFHKFANGVCSCQDFW
ncbi:pentatricopeptide repeat-containing protein At5g48910-like [Salvia splendens]|uniref:pentatricopeptide repeat-containing protein At5g48910-like n=1 Tax=Salvia splendens TaxID=180675 RepID=UPI001C26C02A|nr:pentatricopeptide repeat-containing protein At5g48910-like [Salvia splendens]